MKLPIYVYAYDVYGARTYFRVSKLPGHAKMGARILEDYLTGIAAKKLGVHTSKVRLGHYNDRKFDQGHLPSRVYPGRGGRWLSYTTDD